MSSIAPESFGPLGDAALIGIAWVNDCRDLAIDLESPGMPARRFVFTWASRLSISLTQGENHALQPLTWGGSAAKLSDERIRVALDFPPHGNITLECSEITSGA